MFGKCFRKKEIKELVREKLLGFTALLASGCDLTWVQLPFSKLTRIVFP